MKHGRFRVHKDELVGGKVESFFEFYDGRWTNRRYYVSGQDAVTIFVTFGGRVQTKYLCFWTCRNDKQAEGSGSNF